MVDQVTSDTTVHEDRHSEIILIDAYAQSS